MTDSEGQIEFADGTTATYSRSQGWLCEDETRQSYLNTMHRTAPSYFPPGTVVAMAAADLTKHGQKCTATTPDNPPSDPDELH